MDVYPSQYHLEPHNHQDSSSNFYQCKDNSSIPQKHTQHTLTKQQSTNDLIPSNGSNIQQQRSAAHQKSSSENFDRQADAMATLKLRRLTNLNQRLRNELAYDRIPVSQACQAIIHFTANPHNSQNIPIKDYCVPEIFGKKPANSTEPNNAMSVNYNVHDKTKLISPTSAKFSSEASQGCCVIS